MVAPCWGVLIERRGRGMSPAARRINRGSHRDDGLEVALDRGAVLRRRSALGRLWVLGRRLDLLGVLLLRAPGEHLERRDHDLGLPMAPAGVVVPLARLQAALDVDKLALGEEMAGGL